MDDLVISAYRTEFERLAVLSTVVPYPCEIGDRIRIADKIAVYIGNSPLILCGPALCNRSRQQGENLITAIAASPLLKAALSGLGYSGKLTIAPVAETSIDWTSATPIFRKVSGERKPDLETAGFPAIVIGPSSHSIASVLCVTTVTARALDPSVPDLGDGLRLSRLARMASQESLPAPGMH